MRDRDSKTNYLRLFEGKPTAADKTKKAYINDSRARQKVTLEASKPGATSILVLVEHAWGHRASLTHFHPYLYLGSLNIIFSLKTRVQSFVEPLIKVRKSAIPILQPGDGGKVTQSVTTNNQALKCEVSF